MRLYATLTQAGNESRAWLVLLLLPALLLLLRLAECSCLAFFNRE